ncbi:MAG: hypothetical protein R6V50_08050 [Thermoplasmatota archaeon]
MKKIQCIVGICLTLCIVVCLSGCQEQQRDNSEVDERINFESNVLELIHGSYVAGNNSVTVNVRFRNPLDTPVKVKIFVEFIDRLDNVLYEDSIELNLIANHEEQVSNIFEFRGTISNSVDHIVIYDQRIIE